MLLLDYILKIFFFCGAVVESEFAIQLSFMIFIFEQNLP
jgi:hypothetical protein